MGNDESRGFVPLLELERDVVVTGIPQAIIRIIGSLSGSRKLGAPRVEGAILSVSPCTTSQSEEDFAALAAALFRASQRGTGGRLKCLNLIRCGRWILASPKRFGALWLSASLSPMRTEHDIGVIPHTPPPVARSLKYPTFL